MYEVEDCPIPNKKQKVTFEIENINSMNNDYDSDHPDNEELRLSNDFGKDYEEMMREEFAEICRDIAINNEESVFNELLTIGEKLNESLNMSLVKRQSETTVFLCRSDSHIDQIDQSAYKSRLDNLQNLTNDIVIHFPHLKHQVLLKVEDLRAKINRRFQSLDLVKILSDVTEDVEDLRTWILDTNKNLNIALMYENRGFCYETMQSVLSDIKLHDNIRGSVYKLLQELINMEQQTTTAGGSSSSSVWRLREQFLPVEDALFQLWIRAMEMEEHARTPTTRATVDDSLVRLGPPGEESGFETELSPLFRSDRRLLPAIAGSQKQRMHYISSSGDDAVSESVITDIPTDTESPTPNYVNRNYLSHKHCQKIAGDGDSSNCSQFTLNQTMLEQPLTNYSINSSGGNRRMRKQRKQRRPIETLRSNSFVNMDSRDQASPSASGSLKRRLQQRKSVQSGEPMVQQHNHYHSHHHYYHHHLNMDDNVGLNYSEIAAAADKLVRNEAFWKGSNFSSMESPKESDMEELESAREGGPEIDVNKQWDYYEAPMYSHSDGDSQIIDVKEIREWELDEPAELIDPIIDSDSEPDKLVCMLTTSGYETSLESAAIAADASTVLTTKESCSCVVVLTNLLLGSQLQLHEASRLLATYVCDLLIVRQQASVASTNIQLLSDVLNNDHCCGAQTQNHSLQLNGLLDEWRAVVRSCTVQFRASDSSNGGVDVESLLVSVERDLGRFEVMLSSAVVETSLLGRLELALRQLRTNKTKLEKITKHTDYPNQAIPQHVQHELEMTNNKLELLLEMGTADLNILARCQSALDAAVDLRLVWTKLLPENDSIQQKRILVGLEEAYRNLDDGLEAAVVITNRYHQDSLGNQLKREVSVEMLQVKRILNDFMDQQKFQRQSGGSWCMLGKGRPVQVGVVVAAAAVLGWMLWSTTADPCMGTRAASQRHYHQQRQWDWLRFCYDFTVGCGHRADPH